MEQENIKPINTGQAIDLLLEGKKIDGNWITESEELKLYQKSNSICKEHSILYEIEDLGVEEFYEKYTDIWYMPDKYKSIDIESYVYERCNTETERLRATQELILFKEKDLFSLLQFLMFLVDYFRENNYVWGVGRGSSVSSYVLYLIGIHKIDSIKYNLDITEFLK